MTKRALVAAAICLCGASPASLAHAQSKGSLLDGLHIQLAAGLGSYSASGDGEGPVFDEELGQEFSGKAISGSLLVGHTITDSIVLGGGILRVQSPHPSWNNEDYVDYLDEPLPPGWSSGVIYQRVTGAGVYGAYYPKSAPGLHLQIFAGYGQSYTNFEHSGRHGEDPVGLMLSAALGYERSIGYRLHGGVLAGYVFAPLVDRGGKAFIIHAPSVAATISFH